MRASSIVAIDGGAATGKTTVCLAVAEGLSFGYLNTGAFYRCLALLCLRSAVNLKDPDAVFGLAEGMDIRLVADPVAPSVHLFGEDVTELIRSDSVTSVVSIVAADRRVRAALVERQREAARVIVNEFGGVVADGRDATTVVFPEASVRVLLVATVAARLARSGRSEATFTRQVVERDERDHEVTGFRSPGPGVLVRDVEVGALNSIVDEIVNLARGEVVYGRVAKE